MNTSAFGQPKELHWFYADVNNQTVGPVSLEELHRLAALGIIVPATHVIKEGDGEWLAYSKRFQPTNLASPSLTPPPLPIEPKKMKSPPWGLWLVIIFMLCALPPAGALIALLSKRLTNSQKYVVFGVGCIWLLFVVLGMYSAQSEGEPHVVQHEVQKVQGAKQKSVEPTAQNPPAPLSSSEEAMAAQGAEELRERMEAVLSKLSSAFNSAGSDLLHDVEFLRSVRSCNLEATKIFDEVKTLTEHYGRSGNPYTDIGGSIGYPLGQSAVAVSGAAQAAAFQKLDRYEKQTKEAKEYLEKLKNKIQALPSPPASKAMTSPKARFGISKLAGGFKDKETIIELIQAREAAEKSGDESKLAELRIRQEREKRRFGFNEDLVVHLPEENPDIGGYCEVYAEDSTNLPAQRFWVHKSVLNGEDTLIGSRIITGYMIFRGQKDAMFVGDMPVRELLDLVAGIYEGKISEKDASECVFMPNVQSGDVQNTLDNYVIYSALYTSSRPIIFAVPRAKGNRNPLRSAPLRFIGREEFTNEGGVVFSVPVMAAVDDLK